MTSSRVQVEAIQRALGLRQRGGGHMDVPCRGPDAAMAQQDLDGPQVGTGFEQVGGEAVAQGMDGDVLAQTGLVAGTAAGLPYAIGLMGVSGSAPGKR